ncbi:hypothetical protein CRYUN_Cryun23aG0026500 [Craigia yunnanensis]
MENTSATTNIPHVNVDCVSPETKERIRNTILNFPKEDGSFAPLYLHQGFWFHADLLVGDILVHEVFKAEPSDIFVCSVPKSGTTWLKALTFAIVTRTLYDNFTSPLLNKLSHDCVLYLADFAKKLDIREPGVPLISTHCPYNSLPKSVLYSDCKVVYIWFWKASQENPEKVLFLKYEDMVEDTAFYVKRLAEFMGYNFSLEEEKQGAVQKIVELCSFENMSNLKVNKVGLWQKDLLQVENKFFFRKGKVGDWKNWLTPEMAQRLDKKTEQMLSGSGLTFHISS